MSVTKKGLIEDLQVLYNSNGSVSRNFYRANGKYSESEWQEYFATWADFLDAAGLTESDTPSETNEISGDSWTITLPRTRIHTLEELLDYCKVDLAIWDVDHFVVNKWEVAAKDASKTLQVEPLYQVKAWLKKKVHIVAAKRELEILKEIAKKSAPAPEPVKRPVARANGNILEINIPDIHFGKLAWHLETGYQNYDRGIAEEVYKRALENLLDRVSHFKFDEVLFIVGNDLFNSDDPEYRTTSGTIVTTDGRYQKTMYKVRELMVQSIERLRKIAPVRVMMVYGNHDQTSVWHLGDSLECYFHNYNDVMIENVPTYRKYFQWGKVMLMFTHGDKAKREDYPLLMATEQPQMFGSTKWREAHTGHLHHTKVNEHHGVRVRILPALCPPDDWHAENGYVGNLRSAEAYVWNREEGLVAQVYYNDDAFPIVEDRQNKRK